MVIHESEGVLSFEVRPGDYVTKAFSMASMAFHKKSRLRGKLLRQVVGAPLLHDRRAARVAHLPAQVRCWHRLRCYRHQVRPERYPISP